MSTMHHSESAWQCIFREVLERGETSMGALARRLGLKPASLESHIRPLLRKGLVELRDGRKKIGINRDYGFVIGIDMGASHLHFALAEFRGEILGESNEKIRPEDGPQKTILQIKKGVREITTVGAKYRPAHQRATARRSESRLRALAIGVPSAVDPETRVVAFANNLPGWKNIHLERELEKEFGVPVFLENDANMAAIGERWRGVARGVDNFVFIAIGTGIGSGIFTDGKLYRGRTGWAGELYRMNIEWQRWNEDFGDLGYFEKYVSGLGIAAEGRKSLGSPAQAQAASLADERDAFFVFEAFRQGNAKAQEVLEKIFTMLGVGVANIVAVLDPDLIVFGGGVTKGAPDFLLSTVGKVVRRIHPDPPAIKLSSLKDKAQTYGAIHSALNLAQEACIRRLARK